MQDDLIIQPAARLGLRAVPTRGTLIRNVVWTFYLTTDKAPLGQAFGHGEAVAWLSGYRAARTEFDATYRAGVVASITCNQQG